MSKSEQMAGFFQDENLRQLQERLKIGDGLIDVIDLGENQHSAILAWLFDPREGHAQGEAIVRDFLMHVADQSPRRWRSGKSDKKSTSQGFARNWSVERLQSSGLSACFVATEFAETQANRLDLLIVDPVNRFLIAVENKLGPKFSAEQLKRYRDYVVKLQQSSPWLMNFQLGFVALGRNYDLDDEDRYPKALQKELQHWVPVSYDWLRAGAQRAELHLQRGNEGARLVQEYCRRQTGWESPNEKECSQLVANIWRDHPEAATAVCAMGRRPQKFWLLGKVAVAEAAESAQLFAAQNQAVVLALLDGKGFASVRRMLLRNNAQFESEHVCWGRTWIDVMPRSVDQFYDPESYFPVYLSAYRLNDSHCRVRLVFVPGYMPSESDAIKMREVLAKNMPSIAQREKRSVRRITLKESISNEQLPIYVAQQEEALSRLISESFPHQV
ncbi:PD-(D/E)XK nuclease family protein [Variovorax sp. efr-133-TYG-130]|uniref:PDDEXK-like family protein n=1 Tax=Variovorax sp. efr-133-TYG-130 TaxID=3040327 RepID=UPI0025555A3A|nr:PD-(D/E)XK nuclease family protein [Variovorax sp. efr-133-TYG-130]